MPNGRRFYLVAEEILPDAMLKTIQVKDRIARGEFATVHEAVDAVDLSRSAFYKYRDLVFAYEDIRKRHLITLLFLLEHRQGVLSAVLNEIASLSGNIVTINQGIPIRDGAMATATIDIGSASFSPDEIVKRLESVLGVRKVEIVGYSN